MNAGYSNGFGSFGDCSAVATMTVGLNRLSCWGGSQDLGVYFTTDNPGDDDFFIFTSADSNFNGTPSIALATSITFNATSMTASIPGLTGDHSYHCFILMYFVSVITNNEAVDDDKIISFEDSALNPVEIFEFDSKDSGKNLMLDQTSVGSYDFNQAVVVDVSYNATTGKKQFAIDGNMVSEVAHGPMNLNGTMKLGDPLNYLGELVIGDIILYTG